MNFIFSRKINFIYFFLVICFTSTVLSPRKRTRESDYNPKSILKTPIQHECFDNIHDIFKIDMANRKEKKVYAQYAISYLRYITPEERTDYCANLPPREKKNSPFLLYEGQFKTIINDRYIFQYYELLKDNLDTTDIVSPAMYCLRFTDQEKDCMLKLKENGFPIPVQLFEYTFLNKDIIEELEEADTVMDAALHAFLQKVVSDVKKKDNRPTEESSETGPRRKSSKTGPSGESSKTVQLKQQPTVDKESTTTKESTADKESITTKESTADKESITTKESTADKESNTAKESAASYHNSVDYPKLYIEYLHDGIRTFKKLLWPEEFCRRKYKKT